MYSLIPVTGPRSSLLPLLGIACGSAAGMFVNLFAAKYWALRKYAVPNVPRMNTTIEHHRMRWLRGVKMNSPRALMHACWIVPIIFGLYSLGQGADSNWDVRNYHLYNAFAFLDGKLSIDLAPAGMQSYFNPLLDVPFYLMAMHLPAMLVGFVMGVIHGLNFPLLLGICCLTLSDLPEATRYQTPFWLALAGSSPPTFYQRSVTRWAMTRRRSSALGRCSSCCMSGRDWRSSAYR